MSDTLFTKVKRKLDITWDDADTDARVQDIMDTAEVVLRERLGITSDTFDFSVPGKENQLFVNYCLYEWNHAIDEFYKNYSSIITSTRIKHEVAQGTVMVTLALTNIISSNVSLRTVKRNDYETILTAAKGYSLPEVITIAISEIIIEDYDYDFKTGELHIPGKLITGPIVITAVGVEL